MKKITLIVLGIVLFSSVFGKGYKIHAKVDGLQDTILLLGYYFGDKKYVVDTAHLNSKAEGVFEGDSLLESGIYLVLTPSYKYFELIIDKDQEFGFETDTINLFKKIQFTGSEDNTKFNSYQLATADIQKDKRPLFNDYKKNVQLRDSATISKKEKEEAELEIKRIKGEIEEIDKKVRALEDNVISDSPNSLLTAIIKTMRDVEIPDYPRDADGNITDSLFKYHYLTNHYFDNVDFSNAGLLRTPVYQPKIDNYLDKEIPQIPDTIIVEVDKILTLAEANKKVYKFTLHHLFMKYQNPKIMGLDNIFVHIAEKYYLTGKAWWADEDTAFMNKVKDRYEKMRWNQVGKPSMDMTLFNIGDFMQDTNSFLKNGHWQKLHQIPGKYKVLYYFEPGCGHCRKTIPKWHKMFQENKMREKGVECVLFYTQADTTEWKDFLVKHELFDFVHVFDPYQNTNFRTYYDIYSTPVSYILDEKNVIIAKRIPPETIIDMLDRRIEAEAKEKK